MIVFVFRHLSKIARVTLQLGLLAIFFWFFGLPAIEKYQEKKVVMVESWRTTGGIPAPTLTLFANNDKINGTFQGTYKNGGFEQVCSDLKGNNTIENCINKNSNKKSDFLVDVLLGYRRQISLMSEQLVKEEFSMPREGRYHSLDFPFQMYHGTTFEDQIYLLLSHSFTYYFLLHDPHFFFGLYNPSYPMARLAAVNPNLTKNFYHYLIMTEVEELDLHEDPCNPDPDYSQQTCLKQSLSSQVGCRTRWDRWSCQDLPLCATIDQFRYIAGLQIEPNQNQLLKSLEGSILVVATLATVLMLLWPLKMHMSSLLSLRRSLMILIMQIIHMIQMIKMIKMIHMLPMIHMIQMIKMIQMIQMLQMIQIIQKVQTF